MVGPPLFELADVSLVVDGTTVLDGVDLRIASGRITVVVGPSGSGKSTLLRLLDRLEVPTSGCVSFRGRDIADLDPLALRRSVGMVFQRPAPFPGTVRDNLLVADPDADEEELDAALRAARLDSRFLDRPADDLSGGEAQRMCLARTLVTRPEVLLMDEPTSALDPEARRSLERTARRLSREGREIVWVTHDLAQARALAGDLVVLVDGRVADDRQRESFLADADRDDADADHDDADLDDADRADAARADRDDADRADAADAEGADGTGTDDRDDVDAEGADATATDDRHADVAAARDRGAAPDGDADDVVRPAGGSPRGGDRQGDGAAGSPGTGDRLRDGAGPGRRDAEDRSRGQAGAARDHAGDRPRDGTAPGRSPVEEADDV